MLEEARGKAGFSAKGAHASLMKHRLRRITKKFLRTATEHSAPEVRESPGSMGPG